MSIKDKHKWDEKYKTKSSLLNPRPHSSKLEEYLYHCTGKKTLDLACGVGRNTIFLAKNGFLVDAIDIAKAAIESLNTAAKKEKLSKNINTFLADIESYKIQKDYYDLIVMTNFLDKELIKNAKRFLKSNGVLFIETYMDSDKNEKKGSTSDNILQSQELLELIDNSLEVLHYDEYENEEYELYRMQKQLIVAKKTSPAP